MKKDARNLLYVAIGLVLLFGYPVAYYSSSEIIDITVVDKERITTGSGESLKGKFIIYTKDEVLENSDSMLYFKFASADYQNKLSPGNTYRVKVAGWRIPLLSMYRNVVTLP